MKPQRIYFINDKLLVVLIIKVSILFQK